MGGIMTTTTSWCIMTYKLETIEFSHIFRRNSTSSISSYNHHLYPVVTSDIITLHLMEEYHLKKTRRKFCLEHTFSYLTKEASTKGISLTLLTYFRKLVAFGRFLQAHLVQLEYSSIHNYIWGVWWQNYNLQN